MKKIWFVFALIVSGLFVGCTYKTSPKNLVRFQSLSRSL